MNYTVKEIYQDHLRTTTSDVAAAILTHAECIAAIQQTLSDFDHQICMGIREGLFGDGNDSHSIHDSISSIASAIDEKE